MRVSLLLLRRDQLVASLKPLRVPGTSRLHCRGERWRVFHSTVRGSVLNHSPKSESQVKSPYPECKRTRGNFTHHNQEHPRGSWGHSHESCVPWVPIYVKSGFCLMNIHQEMSGQSGSGQYEMASAKQCVKYTEFRPRAPLSNRVAVSYLDVNPLKLNESENGDLQPHYHISRAPYLHIVDGW